MFVAGKFNTRAVTAADVHCQVDIVCRAQGFQTRALVSDSANNNQAFAEAVCKLPASLFIPEEVLHGEPHQRALLGDFLIALVDEEWSNGGSIFHFDNPPHVLKWVVQRMENKDLLWGPHGLPMMLHLLKDIYEALIKYTGGANKLAYATKLSADHFNSNSSIKMKVAHAAQVVSKKMATIIDVVASDPITYQMPGLPNSITDRNVFFSRIKELCKKFDHWFDICNSKDKDYYNADDFVWIKATTGERYAKELLDMLRWVEAWKDACTIEGKVHWECVF
jgi:hypothetical protein